MTTEELWTPEQRSADAEVIRSLAAFTRAGFKTSHPVPFGSQVNDSRTGRLLVRKRNRVVPDLDPTCHAEVRTIRFACKRIGRAHLKGYTLYTTCEPCPMCLAASLFAGIDRIVYGTVVRHPDATGPSLFAYSARAFAEASLFSCRVDGPVEEALCRALVDDPVVQRYTAKMAKKGVFL